MRPSIARSLALTACLVLTLASCGDGEDATGPPSSGTQAPGSTEAGSPPDGPDPTPVAVRGTTVAELDDPIAMLPRPGDTRLWVAERSGLVRTLEVGPDGQLSPVGDPVLDLTDHTTTDGERGLLGMAFSDDGSRLFVSYTDLDGTSLVVAHELGDASGTPATLDPDGGVELLRVDQPFSNHNGGHLVLGPDGLLWFGLGDGGAADDPDNRAQDPDDLLGKVLRLDPDKGEGPVEAEIVVTGVRNPWRFAFDTDGSLWIADVGQNEFEEIDRLPADSIEGANLGWSGYEGSAPYLDGDGRRPADPVMPVFEYSHEGGNCSITGGFVYRGTAIEGLQGAYLFADFCAGRVRAIRVDDAGRLVAEHDLEVDVASPISFGTDGDGEAYVLSGQGPIVRLDAAS